MKKVSQGTETEISTLRRLKKQKKPPRRSIPAANPVDEAGSASPTTAERRSRDGTKLIRGGRMLDFRPNSRSGRILLGRREELRFQGVPEVFGRLRMPIRGIVANP